MTRCPKCGADHGSPDVEARPSLLHGFGSFAVRPIAKGRRVFGVPCVGFNWSRTPNVTRTYLKGRVVLRHHPNGVVTLCESDFTAVRHIRRGEELTVPEYS